MTPFSMSNLTSDMFGGDDEAPASAPSSNTSSKGAHLLRWPGVPAALRAARLQMAEIRRFEKEMFAGETDMRVRETVEALREIARNVSGYPGRKNLIWISTSFPMTIAPDAVAGQQHFPVRDAELRGPGRTCDQRARRRQGFGLSGKSGWSADQSFFMATKAPATA